MTLHRGYVTKNKAVPILAKKKKKLKLTVFFNF